MKWLLLMLCCVVGLSRAQQADVGKLCQSCHAEYVDDVKSHKHGARGISCEACHGVSTQHRNSVGASSPDKVAAPDEVPALCGTCHQEQRKLYATSAHGKLVAASSKTRAANCGTCHGVHAQRNETAMKRQCDRCHTTLPAACVAKPLVAVAAGKLSCAGCHNPHTLAR
ncbi:MAG TPA: cytochrome c3 family protein [Bryobacteraceae bacterium]|nr:cytochrome c3 family protein [Bryobacteraceae bacterium]